MDETFEQLDEMEFRRRRKPRKRAAQDWLIVDDEIVNWKPRSSQQLADLHDEYQENRRDRQKSPRYDRTKRI